MQLKLSDQRSPNCPFVDRIENEDDHCFGVGMERTGYETIAEDSPSFEHWMSEINGVGLQDIIARPIPVPELPRYLPTITRGSQTLFTDYRPEFVGVSLGDVVSTEKLYTPTSLRERFGIPAGTKVILLAYGRDRLIENLWPERKQVFARLAQLGFAAATSINYSIWAEQPHAERLINIKRSSLSYKSLQQAGIPAIPHIYWHGRKDLTTWVKWLEANPAVNTAAINLQTIRHRPTWARAIEDLLFLVDCLPRPIHFMITGPQEFSRVRQINKIFPSLTLTNGYTSRMAAAKQLIVTNGVVDWLEYTKGGNSETFKKNIGLYEQRLAA